MSDSQAYEEIRVSSDGVSVTKRFEEDEFPVPAIAFEFSSSRDEAVTVRLVDTVPDEVEVEDLGFHPEYGSEFWTIDDKTIAFERDLEANAEYMTVYGIRATGSEDVDKFLTEPTLEEVDPPLPEDAEAESENIIPESGDDVVKDVIAGDGEVPGLEDDEQTTPDEEVETLDLKDPNQAEAAAAQAQQDESGDTSEDETAAATSNVVQAMAAEIRQQNVSAEDIQLLRRAFDVAAEDGGSTKAKVQQLQSDISDLRAYTTALEEFLDENGTGEELIEEFQSELADFSEQLESFDSKLAENSQQIESVSGEVNSRGEEVDEVSTDVSEVRNEMDQIQNTLDAIESDIDEIEDEMVGGDIANRLEEIETDLGDLIDWQEQIKSTFG